MHVSMNHKEGVWIVSVFEKIHNHDLLSPSKIHLIRSHRKVSSKRALINEWEMLILRHIHKLGCWRMKSDVSLLWGAQRLIYIIIMHH
ncbi:unnamed protein product [Cuscuta europaea]|uniref:Protein FAR1-RELATED SEQUENCE n=1 Tax=Cuscuta europaea TaxID=41803 RepID=A0A9P0ZRB3_CUSEU|nr:unnamed protein product [Cuscuta europaea]